MKKLFNLTLLVGLLFAGSLQAQFNAYKTILSKVTDSTAATPSGYGAIRYNTQGGKNKWQFDNGSGFVDFGSGGSSFTLAPGNGTTVNGGGDGVDLGGTVTSSILYDFGGNYYHANNIAAFNLFTPATTESIIWDGTDFNVNVASGASFRLGASGAEITGDVYVGETGGKVGFLGATPVVKQSAVTTPQGIADALTSYGLLSTSTIDQYWPSSGSYSLTGNLTINGGGSRSINYGTFGNFLNGFGVYSDANIILSGGTSSTVKYTLNPGVRHLFDGVVRMDDLATGGADKIVIADTNGDLGTATIDGVLPSQTGNNGKVLQTDGTNATWQTAGGGSGTVTSVAASVPSFLSISGSPITTSGTLAISLSGTALPVANGGTGLTSLGTGVATWLGTPSWTNFNSAITGTSPFYSLASGGTATGTNTFAMGSNPFILTSGVTTGTGATAGIQNVFNSLTTGNGLDISTSSLTSGKGLALTSTSTAINHTRGTNALFSSRISGANANSTRTAIAGEFVATNTGTGSTNTAVYAAASGGTNNYSIYASGQMYVEGIASSGYVAYFKASGVNQGMFINSNGSGVSPISNNFTDLGNASQQFKNAFLYGNIAAGGITTVLARIHSRGAGTTTGYNILTENSAATARFGVRDNGAIEFSGSAGTAGQIPVSAGASSPPVWTDQTIQTVKVTVSSAELLALNSTPKTLIAAGGAGTIIQVISCLVYLDYNSVAYNTNVDLDFYTGTFKMLSTNILSSTTDLYNNYDLDLATATNVQNQPLTVTADSGNPLSGNSPVYVYLTYRIITL